MKLLKFILSPGSWEDNGQDCKTDCLWCGHRALELSNEPPHQFQCWSCKQTGNGYTLLQKYYADLPDLKRSEGEELVRWKPGTSPQAFRSAGVKRSTRGYIWPVFNAENKVVALYRYGKTNNTFYSTPKPFSLNILGVNHLSASGVVYVVEGHWDYAAFQTNVEPGSHNVLGLCGSSWPTKQLSLLENREVVWLGDNDEAGQSGVHSLATRMKRSSILPLSLKYLNWGELSIPTLLEIPDKFDIRDLCVELFQ